MYLPRGIIAQDRQHAINANYGVINAPTLSFFSSSFFLLSTVADKAGLTQSNLGRHLLRKVTRSSRDTINDETRGVPLGYLELTTTTYRNNNMPCTTTASFPRRKELRPPPPVCTLPAHHIESGSGVPSRAVHTGGFRGGCWLQLKRNSFRTRCPVDLFVNGVVHR